MKRIGEEEYKSLLVEMMKFIHDFCQNNNIQYSLAYGTLIGAIRHKGFIPWDDDIDILMLRPDYEKFLSLFNNNGSGIYRVASYETDHNFRYTLAKIVNDKTVNNELGYDKYGVGIDLFPIDKVPRDNKVVKQLFKRHECYWKIFALKNMKWNSQRGLVKNFIMLFLKLLFICVPFSFLHKRMIKSALKYRTLTDNYCLGCLFAPYGIKNMMPREVYADVFLSPFEKYSFCCLKNYDFYLKKLYGNYMELPPKEKRITHHDIDAYWK